MQLPARLGKYELQQFLGGGMSQVYRAFDTVIGRTVAVKILSGEAARDPDARERFLDEARTAAKATHENVISIFDFGVDDQMGLFIVMEFLEGEDLRSAIKGGRTGDLRGKLKIALQAARALDFVHQHRIIHRDVKPENLHLNSTGTVKLMDFGIAKSEDFSRTQPGFALGTPYYMAPEQVRGEKLSCQADVYAYGILLFELMSGQRPFVADTVEGIFYGILNMPLRVEPLQAAGVPQPVIDLIVGCTAKSAAERPQGMAPVIADLARLQDALAAESRPAPAPSTSAAPPPPQKKLSRALLAAGICAGVLALAAGAYFAFRPGSAPKPAELPATLSTPTGPMVLVPAGEFQFGQAKQRATLPAFYIDRTEVTNAAWQQFCQATNHPRPDGFAADKPDFPVVNITAAEALDFAKWAGKRLPTDLEWEKAARGTDGRRFPWGDESDISRANVGSNAVQAVNAFRSGASPSGGLQFVGNVWEFVDKLRAPPSDIRRFQAMQPPARLDEPWYMIRGQSAAEPLLENVIWDSYAVPARWKDPFIGFRCAQDPPR